MYKCVITMILVITIDQFSKYIATTQGLVHLNTGVSFGLLPLPLWLMIICLLGILIGFGIMFKEYWLRHTIVAGVFFGSAISNIIDRILFSGVKDWLLIPFTTIYNNIADWLLFFAIICMLLTFKAENKHEQQTI